MRKGMAENTALIVRRLLAMEGVTQNSLAEELGVNQSSINRWLKGGDLRSTRYEQLLKYAQKKGVLNHRKFDLTQSTVLSDMRSIPLAGHVGAGAAVYRVAHDSVTDRVENVDVPLAFGDVKALMVKGDSMYPAYRDGDVLLFGTNESGVDSLVGRECLVITGNDEWLVKILERGTKQGRFDLFSHNAAPIRDVEIIEATPVRYVIKK